MILLDTMVVLEPLRSHPNARVVAWLDAQEAETVFVAALTLAEVIRGLERLPAADRRIAKGRTVAEKITALFETRVLAFDVEAAVAYTRVLESVRRTGGTISRHDGQLAATALSYSCAVATGESVPFIGAGCHVINPWYW
jgi:predicted nucleic acid-binding protein